MNIVTLFGLPVLSLGAQQGEKVLKRDDAKGIVKIYLGEAEQTTGVQLVGNTTRGGVYLSVLRRAIPVNQTHDLLSPHFNYGATKKVFA